MKKYFYQGFLAATFVLGMLQAQASEFFIKINRNGQHTVLFSDQYQTNTSNIYRFFDVQPGIISLKVSDANTGNMVYDGAVTLGVDERVVAEMNVAGGITVIATSKVTYTNWYTQNNQVATTPNNTPTPAPTGPVAVDDAKFQEMKKVIDKEIADHAKVSKAKAVTKKHFFTAKQIAEVCKLMTFDNYKLDYAKYAYDFCVDKSNYFVVSDVFQFSTYSKELDDYIDKKD